MIKKIPIPFCGVALGLIAAGNLVQAAFPWLRPIFGALGTLVLVLFLLKLLLFFPVFREEMGNPVLASISGTFCMACMLLSVYIQPLLPVAGRLLWFGAVLLHVALILYFSIRFMRKLKPAEYHASFYIVYVGIATAAISAPAWKMQALGKGIAVFALLAFLSLVVPVTRRYLGGEKVPAALQPLFMISAAPTSLCIVGFKNSFGDPWIGLLIFLFVLGTLFYLPAVVMAFRKLGAAFFPSLAACTFPLVISAIATGTMRILLGDMDPTGLILAVQTVVQYWFWVQTIIAVFMTAVVLIRYCLYLSDSQQSL